MEAEYEKKLAEYDGIWLLKVLQEKIIGRSAHENASVSVRGRQIQVLLTRHGDQEKTHQHFNRFKSNKDNLE